MKKILSVLAMVVAMVLVTGVCAEDKKPTASGPPAVVKDSKNTSSTTTTTSKKGVTTTVTKTTSSSQCADGQCAVTSACADGQCQATVSNKVGRSNRAERRSIFSRRSRAGSCSSCGG